MQTLILLLALFICSWPEAQAAGLEKLTIKNLDLDYKLPYGQGEFERLQIGISLWNPRYPVEIHRQSDAILLSTPFIDFSWMGPLAFVHDLQKVSTRKLSLEAHRQQHFVKAQTLAFTPKDQGEYIFSEVDLACQGPSLTGDLHQRLMTDCRHKMQGTIAKLDVPVGSFLPEVLTRLPLVPDEIDTPAWAIYLNMEQGEFYTSFWLKSWLSARLHTWGSMHYENDFKTIAIKIDRIRYGYLPVTSIIMRELQNRIKHPNVSVNPPWIRIQLDKK